MRPLRLRKDSIFSTPELLRLRKRALERYVRNCSPPPNALPGRPIYHYTDEAGMRGILGSGKLRLTHIGTQKDSTELDYSIECVQDFLEIQINLGNWRCTNSLALTMDVIADRQDNPVLSFTNHFAGSFSLNGNSDHQWMNYGARGTGYCLAFSANDLLDYFCSKCTDRDSISMPNLVMTQVTYSPTAQVQMLLDILEEVESSYASLVARNGVTEKMVKAHGAVLGLYLLETALTFKCAKAFSDEEEYRLVYANRFTLDTGEAILPHEEANRSGRVHRWRDEKLGKVGSELMPLLGITIGPNADKTHAERTLRAICDKHGYFDLTID